MTYINRLAGALSLAAALLVTADLQAQPPGNRGRADADRDADMALFHELLDKRQDIKREVKNFPNGSETVTVSDKLELAKKIQEHAEAMHRRVKEGRGIHLRDPLFAALFREYRKIEMTVERIERGVKVTETSADAHVAKLIQAHAAVVSKFIKLGHEEVRKNHPVPERERKP